jgi:hypothetical protein
MSSPIPKPEENRLSVRIIKITGYQGFVGITVEIIDDLEFNNSCRKKGLVISYNMTYNNWAVLFKLIGSEPEANKVTKGKNSVYLDKDVVFQIARPKIREVRWPKLFGKTVIPDMMEIHGRIPPESITSK